MLIKIKKFIEEGNEYFNSEILASNWFFKVFTLKYPYQLRYDWTKYLIELGYQYNKRAVIDQIGSAMYTKKPMTVDEMRIGLNKALWSYPLPLDYILKIDVLINKGGQYFNRSIISSADLFRVTHKEYPHIKVYESKLFKTLDYIYRGCYIIDGSLHKMWSKEPLSKKFKKCIE